MHTGDAPVNGEEGKLVKEGFDKSDTAGPAFGIFGQESGFEQFRRGDGGEVTIVLALLVIRRGRFLVGWSPQKDRGVEQVRHAWLAAGAREFPTPGSGFGFGKGRQGGKEGGEIRKTPTDGSGADFSDGAAAAEEKEGFAPVGDAVDAVGEVPGGFGEGKGLGGHGRRKVSG